MTQEREGEQALSVLRGIWTTQQQSAVDLDAGSAGNTKVCKNMKNIGFGGIAGDGPADSTAGPVGEDLRAAWRSKLAREGKLGATSVRDLVLGDPAPGAGDDRS